MALKFAELPGHEILVDYAAWFRFKTLENKTSIDPENISGKYIRLYKQAVGNFEMKTYVNPGLS